MSKKTLIIAISIIAVLLIVVFGVVVGIANNSNKDSGELQYMIGADGNYMVIGIGDCKDTHITIPDEYNGKPVTNIGSGAFRNCKSIVSVTIGNNITDIGDKAFDDCKSLEKVVIGDSVTSIGGAFYGCSSLTTVILSESVNEIIKDALWGFGNIEYTEYKQCFYLGTADNPYYALINNKIDWKTDFEIHEDTKIIASGAFYQCSNITELTIPDGVTHVGYEAFYRCTNIEGVKFGSSVISIGQNAFAKCSSLESVELSEAIVNLSSRAFSECVKLKFNEYNGGKYIGTPSNPYFALVDVVSKTQSTYEIHSNTVIISGAFSDCELLESINIPSSVKVIGQEAFFRCKLLTNIDLPNSVTSIYNSAFAGCTSLTSIRIPDSVTSIYDSAFVGCASLTSIRIPTSVNQIGRNVFDSEMDVYYDGTKDNWNSIDRNPYWISSYHFTIHCTDGDILSYND